MVGIQAVKVDDIDDALDTPGAFELLRYESIDGDKYVGMSFICPCGCKRAGWLPLLENGQVSHTSPEWNWDGNESNPTLTPSVLQVGGCQWHGWLRNGVWVVA